MVTKYNRDIRQLESKACLWWPPILSEKEATTSIIPMLLKSQDEFLSILVLSKKNPKQVFDVLNASKFPSNLFLKHLVVLADFGGEQIQRMNAQFHSVFPVAGQNSPNGFEYIWDEKIYFYQFQVIPIQGVLNNNKLNIDGKGLLRVASLDSLTKDMIMILLHGASATDSTTTKVLGKCEIGSFLGKSKELNQYVKQKYIWVSRITGGAQANALGQIAQNYLFDYLLNTLKEGYQIQRNGQIDGVTQTDGRTLIQFDIVVKKGILAVAVEVSFQVTTNSTIERKAGQAANRYRMLKERGHYIAYVIDGAGNFQRRSAISTICDNSDCTVAYTDDEFEVLTKFIVEALS